MDNGREDSAVAPDNFSDRRRFLAQAATSVAASALAGACGAAGSIAAPADATAACGDAATGDAAAGNVWPSLAGNPPLSLETALAAMPFRQDDPAWGKQLMWDRDLVIKAATTLNGETKKDAEALLRKFADGNNIANEGCQLSCLAMILRLFDPDAKPAWDPGVLNDLAHAYYYYTPCGLSLVTLYADLVSDVSAGAVQCCLKEEYLPAQPGWPKVFAHTAPLVRAYRALSPSQRSQFAILLKTGTYDDTVASHFALLHPHDTGGVDDPNPLILDPAMPAASKGPWRLTDSAKAILEDPAIAAAWKRDAIEPNQIAGVWVFSRWRSARDRSYLAPLVGEWVKQLAALEST